MIYLDLPVYVKEVIMMKSNVESPESTGGTKVQPRNTRSPGHLQMRKCCIVKLQANVHLSIIMRKCVTFTSCILVQIMQGFAEYLLL